MSTLILQALNQIEEIKNKEDGLSGVPSGFSELDRITSGWQKSDLVILAARPGMGKLLSYYQWHEILPLSLICLWLYSH